MFGNRKIKNQFLFDDLPNTPNSSPPPSLRSELTGTGSGSSAASENDMVTMQYFQLQMDNLREEIAGLRGMIETCEKHNSQLQILRQTYPQASDDALRQHYYSNN